MWRSLVRPMWHQTQLKTLTCQQIKPNHSIRLFTQFKPKTPRSSVIYRCGRFESSDSSAQKEKFVKPEPAPAPKRSGFVKFLSVFASGAIAFFAISYYLDSTNASKKQKTGSVDYSSPNLPGRIIPTKSIEKEKNPGGIKITLYQYVTCPFCCKVRAYLDYYGYSYDIVEVNSISKNQINWSDYKKVPIVAVRVPKAGSPDELDEKIIQLNDSSVIISALDTFRLDPTHPLEQVVKFYEAIDVDSKGEKKTPEFNNRYFVMLHNDNITDRKTVSERKDERDWRSWVDSKFVHVISPNIYRTFDEAIQSFKWFERAGEWDKQFNAFERFLIIYMGSVAMYFVAKKLKKKYNLKEDVRQSFYEVCEEWTRSLNNNYAFRGGKNPNLSDLALYGCMTSFEGCEAFSDLMRNPKLKSWYDDCKEHVTNSKGRIFLNVNYAVPIPKVLPKEENKPNGSSSTSSKTKRFILF